ncbi:MAG: 4Fe-4S binding protein [Alphaproteobacteria bacterium]|nr:4Fe-4S binding protein [Alphaproteobacteria bacterium]
MVSVVTDACVKCKACVEVCPVDAFHEADTQLVVDPDTCIGCGVCISECPQEAIVTDDEADDAAIKFNAENAKTCPNANE